MQLKNYFSNAMKFHPNLKIHTLEKILKSNEFLFFPFVLDKRIMDLRVRIYQYNHQNCFNYSFLFFLFFLETLNFMFKIQIYIRQK